MALVEVMLWGVERMSRTSPWGRMGVDMPADENHRAGRNWAGSTG
jgi:putative component of membrane protein insertase Oxa1/YidC/SpoIIIJ protein YidD